MTSVAGLDGCSGPLTTLLVSAGGKGSGIFDESGPVQTRPRLNPPGGKTSDIFGSPVAAASPTAHPNKPKVWMRSEGRPKGEKGRAGARHLAKTVPSGYGVP